MYDDYDDAYEIDLDTHKADAARACRWAAEVLADPTTLVLDTETTGLRDPYVCDLGVANATGIVFDKRLNPQAPITPTAARIHGITEADVSDAPTWADIHEEFVDAIQGRRIIIWNAAFDTGVIRNECSRHGRTLDVNDVDAWVEDIMATARWECAMLAAAAWIGDWNDYHGNYTWPKLDRVAPQYADHSAIGDCRGTWSVLKRMAAEVPEHVPAQRAGGAVDQDDRADV